MLAVFGEIRTRLPTRGTSVLPCGVLLGFSILALRASTLVLLHSLNFNHSQAVPATAREIQLRGRTQGFEPRPRYSAQKYKRVHKGPFCIFWRRGRDSNPGRSLNLAGFQDQCFRPLSHLSIIHLSGQIKHFPTF